MSAQNLASSVSSWEQLQEIARNNTSARRGRRLGQLPSSVPIASSIHISFNT